MRKVLLVLFIIILVMIVGCDGRYGQNVVLKTDPIIIDRGGFDVSFTDTLYIYQEAGFVTKTVLVEDSRLLDGDNVQKLKEYAEITNETFTSDRFPSDGYTYTNELSEESYSWEMTYDYTQMNIKEELNNKRTFLLIEDFFDDEYRIPYDKFLEAYQKSGYTLSE